MPRLKVKVNAKVKGHVEKEMNGERNAWIIKCVDIKMHG
jgi:hypothetical protein